MVLETVTIEVPRRFALRLLRHALSELELSLEEEAQLARALDQAARQAVEWEERARKVFVAGLKEWMGEPERFAKG